MDLLIKYLFNWGSSSCFNFEKENSPSEEMPWASKFLAEWRDRTQWGCVQSGGLSSALCQGCVGQWLSAVISLPELQPPFPKPRRCCSRQTQAQYWPSWFAFIFKEGGLNPSGFTKYILFPGKVLCVFQNSWEATYQKTTLKKTREQLWIKLSIPKQSYKRAQNQDANLDWCQSPVLNLI